MNFTFYWKSDSEKKDDFIKTDDVIPNGLFKKQTIIWRWGKPTEINRG